MRERERAERGQRAGRGGGREGEREMTERRGVRESRGVRERERERERAEKGERKDKGCIIIIIIIIIIISIIINPLTARVAGPPQMILQPIFSIFVLHCPLGLAELQVCPCRERERPGVQRVQRATAEREERERRGGGEGSVGG